MICSIQSFIRRIKLIVIIALSMTIASIDSLPFGGTWRQVGSDIDGKAQNDISGISVAMSADGKTIVIGAPYNNMSSGLIRVYTLNSTIGNWQQIGADITGKADFDYFGRSVCISDDGKTIAAGAIENDNANGFDSGQVRVYLYNIISKMWVQVGSDINGEAANDRFGYFVDMSADGKTIAIGGPLNSNSNSGRSGHVRVYAINTVSGNWTQVGADIDGKATDDQSGKSLAMSSDGTIIAIGAPYNDNANGVYAGHVRVFSNNSTSRNWTQVGLDINGKSRGANFGYSVVISSDGTTIAIGAPYYINSNSNVAGYVRVYTINGMSGNWTQVGLDIDGIAVNDNFGFSVALSSDGKTIAVGAPTNSGCVRVFSMNTTSGNWAQVGLDILGEAQGDAFGASVAISNDGFTVAIGAPFNDNSNNSNAGHVRVYKYELPPTKAPTRMPTKSPTKPPTKFPTKTPTRKPTKAPSKSPTKFPTRRPTKDPTKSPTNVPTKRPTKNPTKAPSIITQPVPIAISIQVPSTTPVTVPTNCGLFGWNFFCPRRGECGFWRRLLNLHGC